MDLVLTLCEPIKIKSSPVEASRGAKWRGTKCDCKNWLWVRSPLEEVKYLLKFIFPFLRSGVELSAALSSAT